MKPMDQFAAQVVGNAGLFYVAYRLSQMGWNVLTTSRNAIGYDIVLLDRTAKSRHTVQVKTLSKRDAVPLGRSFNPDVADFLVICRSAGEGKPECFILPTTEVRGHSDHNKKTGQTSLWLESKEYAVPDFQERWDRLGMGS